jgi:hypothetical protein
VQRSVCGQHEQWQGQAAQRGAVAQGHARQVLGQPASRRTGQQAQHEPRSSWPPVRRSCSRRHCAGSAMNLITTRRVAPSLLRQKAANSACEKLPSWFLSQYVKSCPSSPRPPPRPPAIARPRGSPPSRGRARPRRGAAGRRGPVVGLQPEVPRVDHGRRVRPVRRPDGLQVETRWR